MQLQVVLLLSQANRPEYSTLKVQEIRERQPAAHIPSLPCAAALAAQPCTQNHWEENVPQPLLISLGAVGQEEGWTLTAKVRICMFNLCLVTYKNIQGGESTQPLRDCSAKQAEMGYTSVPLNDTAEWMGAGVTNQCFTRKFNSWKLQVFYSWLYFLQRLFSRILSQHQ